MQWQWKSPFKTATFPYLLFFVGEIAFYHRMSAVPFSPGPFSESAVTLASPKTISHTHTLSAHSALALLSVGHILVLAPFALGVFIFPLSLVVVVSSMLFPYFSPFFSAHMPRPASNLFPFNFFLILQMRARRKKSTFAVQRELDQNEMARNGWDEETNGTRRKKWPK